MESASYFSYDKIKSQINSLDLPSRNNIVPYGQAPTTGVQAGQLSWTRVLFWNKEQSDFLPLGEITTMGLLSHYEKAVLTKEMTIDVFDERLIDNQSYEDQDYLSNVLYKQGGYFFDVDSELLVE